MELFPKLYKPKKGTKPANCEISYWRDLTAKLIDKPFKQVAGLTRNLDTKAIKDLYEMATSFKKNSAALWWQLLKKTRS